MHESRTLAQGVEDAVRSAFHAPQQPMPVDSATSSSHSVKVDRSNVAEKTIYSKLTTQHDHPNQHTSVVATTIWDRLTNPFKRGWVMEILSCLLSSLALVGIIIVLAVYGGRPLPQWPKSISINSLLAVFTAIQKAGLLLAVSNGICQLKWQHFRQPHLLIDLERFDAASRGPWGAFMLIFKLPGEFLGAMGAFVVLASLAIDPFLQQVVSYAQCESSLIGVVATVPRTNNYTRVGDVTDNGTSLEFTSVDTSFIDAFYVGMSNVPRVIRPFLSGDCSTGNCTFPIHNDANETYASLSMCYSYNEITDIDSRKSNETGPVFTTPDGIQLLPRNTLMTMVTGGMGDGTNNIITFDTVMRRYTDCSNDNIKECRTLVPYAFRSSFFPCLKTFSGIITNGALEETVITSTPVPYMAGGFVLTSNKTLQDGQWHDCVPASSVSSSNPVKYPFDDPLTPSKNNNTVYQYYPANCIWWFEPLAAGTFADLVATQFNQTLVNDNANPRAAVGPYHLLKLAQNGTANADSVRVYLSALTDAFTANIRENVAAPRSEFARGTVLQSHTCALVTWRWLTLPLFLQFLGMVFVAGVAIRSARWKTGPPVWKSSELALLFHGFDQQMLQRHSHLEMVEDMTAHARLISASLNANTSSGWKFQELETLT